LVLLGKWNPAEICAARIRIRRAEAGMVEGVERVDAQLKRRMLGKAEVLAYSNGSRVYAAARLARR
jgi:hypothetical protein